MVATIEQGSQNFYCSDCTKHRTPSKEVKRMGQIQHCKDCGVWSDMGSRDQKGVLSMLARRQRCEKGAPSPEDFERWATSISSQNTAAGGTWSISIPKVSSSSSYRSENRLPKPYKMQQLV